MRRTALISILLLTSALPSAATPGTLIEEDAGRECMVNEETSVYTAPSLNAKVAFKTAATTDVQVIGGKQFGPPVAYPATDEEFARTWFHVRTSDWKVGWVNAALVDCGG